MAYGIKTGYGPIDIMYIQLGKNKHVTEGHLTIFCNTFTNFLQSTSNNHYFSLWYTIPTISYLYVEKLSFEINF